MVKSKRRIFEFKIFIAILITAALSPISAAFIPPSHPLIRYMGRFDKRDTRGFRFDWPGSMIELRFGGTSCEILIRGDGGHYNIFVDDSFFVMRFDTLKSVHKIVYGLSDTIPHTLRMVKRFEGMVGRVAELYGFYIDDRQKLYPLSPPPPYRIEFVGGSNLLGFGIEANSVECKNPGALSNSYQAFGSIAARALNAEYHIIAMSGKGTLRNWGDPFIASMRPFGHYYKRAVRNDPNLMWDFKSWTPHIVVLYFGTNDFSTPPTPPKALFLAHYRNFIEETLSRGSAIKVVCVTSSREPVREYVGELVQKLRDEGDIRVHFYSFRPIPNEMLGCDWHYNAAAQAIIGKELAEVIRPLLTE